MNPIEINLLTIAGLNDFFPVIISYLNPREHGQLAGVCEKTNTIMQNIWKQPQYNTVENRSWMAEFYAKQKNIQKPLIKNFQAFFRREMLFISKMKGSADLPDDSPYLDPIHHMINNVLYQHSKQIASTLNETFIQGLVNVFSTTQIKKIIEWSQHSFLPTLPNIANISKILESIPIETKLDQLFNELTGEIQTQFQKLEHTLPPINLSY